MKVVSIDPGYDRMGCAVMERENGRITLLYSDCLQTDRAEEYGVRLVSVGDHLKNIIETYDPDHVAMETVFFSKNKKTAMRVSEARGVCVYIAEKSGKKIFEYTPNQVKQAVTGSGNAGKDQVMRMIPHFVTIDGTAERNDDEYDAIAVGITHCANSRPNIGTIMK